MEDAHIKKLAKEVLEIGDVIFTIDDIRSRLELGRHAGPVQRPGYNELIEILGNCYLDLSKIEQAFKQLIAALDISAEIPTDRKE